MDSFHAGRATTMVATDIAARGIHVDDITLVVHADPPSEHKAYLHRSGRTARAGAAGTVITLMTEDQVRDVRDLTRAAGIKPTITRVDSARHPVLTTLAPGERVLVAGGLGVTAEEPERRSGGGRNRGRSGGQRRSGGQPRSGGQSAFRRAIAFRRRVPLGRSRWRRGQPQPPSPQPVVVVRAPAQRGVVQLRPPLSGPSIGSAR